MDSVVSTGAVTSGGHRHATSVPCRTALTLTTSRRCTAWWAAASRRWSSTSAPGLPFIGVPLKDLNLRKGLLVAGIVRRNGAAGHSLRRRRPAGGRRRGDRHHRHHAARAARHRKVRAPAMNYKMVGFVLGRIFCNRSSSDAFPAGLRHCSTASGICCLAFLWPAAAAVLALGLMTSLRDPQKHHHLTPATAWPSWRWSGC